jgi:DNA repair exonuclease SbcCD ATPase subunit
MFDIEWVELEDFRSYRGRHKIILPTQPGLYLITGINELEPRLGSNGVGKSTLLDAIYWCLYGKTTRGLKAGDVVSWGEKSCSVSVKLTVGDKPLQISRAQSPNSLEVDGTPSDQASVLKHLRLGPETFTYAVLLPQFGESFFALLPAAKLTLFSEIMGLDYWLKKSQEAEELANTLLEAKHDKERMLSKQQGYIEFADKDLEILKVSAQEFDKDQRRLVVELKKELQKVTESIQFAKSALVNIENKLAKLGADSSVCPTCKQKVDNEQVIKDRTALLRNQRDFEQDQAVGLSSLKRIRSELDEYPNQANPYQEQIQQKLDNKKAAEKRLKEVTAEIESLEQDHAAVSFWVNGFKRIRLFIVEQTLRQLEIEVNNNMSSLGLTDWRIEFDVERENKSGGITKGFVVFVYAPNNAEPVRFEAWSGGETQRLRLAGDLGLADLIMERAGLSSTIEFFDEPSRHLSQEGLLDVAETLHARALQGSKRIFLVDHQTIEFGDFAGKLVISKSEMGSRLSAGL